jgi:hypothetical protein
MSAPVPVGHEASSLAIADEVGLEPAGEPVLTGRRDEAVGDEHEGAVGERDAFGPPEVLVKDVPESRLVERGTDDEDRPPVRGIADLGFRGIVGFDGAGAGEEPAELGEHRDEEILAPEVGDDALLDLSAFAVGFDDADVFVDGAAGGADFHGSRVHANHYHDEPRGFKVNSWYISGITRVRLSLHFSGWRRVTPREGPGKQGVFARGSRRPSRLHPKHGLVFLGVLWGRFHDAASRGDFDTRSGSILSDPASSAILIVGGWQTLAGCR